MTHSKLPVTLAEHVEKALAGGSEQARARHVASGKHLVRDRLARFFDAGTLVEDGLLAGVRRGLPGDAVVTCVGTVGGRPVAVIANDMTVKAGTWGYTSFSNAEKFVRTSATGRVFIQLMKYNVVQRGLERSNHDDFLPSYGYEPT